ncbi:HET-domain-containing protein [Xylaria grammica]|nr:HET-domain-containing protein [Xylaria grammica]
MRNRMSYQCEYCANLSISHLVELAEQEFVDGYFEFPSHGFYPHQPSLTDLEASALRGCVLCQLILEYLHGAEGPPDSYMRMPLPYTGRAIDSEKKSAYSFARDLPRNHVRICIRASHMVADESLDRVRVFDRLVVQVGDVEDPDATPVTGSLPPLALVLKTPHNEPVYVKNYRIGRYELDPDLGSPRNMNLARGWLRTCREQHTGCLVAGSPALPTRVIDVGPADGSQAPRLISGEGLKDDYVALSHCWGGSITPVLDAQTFDAFKNAIPVAELPPNLRDAIVITRELGIRFLWIDSLCILQDSKRDWELEAQKMGAVYRNCTVVISASASPGSKHGILGGGLASTSASRAPKRTHIKIYDDALADDPALGVRVEIENMKEETLEALATHGPLASRGWTLQESILAPRQLFYGVRQIYWRCRQGFECAEGLPPGGNRTPSEEYSNATQMLHFGIARTETSGVDIGNGVRDSNDSKEWEDRSYDVEEVNAAVIQDYYDLVQEYSHRRLTIASDKLPAFSGLARGLRGAFARYDPGSDPGVESKPAIYLAGLWVSDFHRGLTWLGENGTCRHAPIYRAPSWSWSSTDEPVVFQGARESHELDLQLLDYTVEARNPGNPFGEIASAELVVRGRTKQLRRSTQVIGSKSFRHFGSCRFDDAGPPDHPRLVVPDLILSADGDGDCFVSLYRDFFAEKTQTIDRDLISATEYLVLLVSLYYDDDDEAVVHADCLVIQPLCDGNETKYERTGMTTILSVNLDWIQSWDTRTLKLV